MSHATGAEGSDTAVYPELARANLLRMRGDYKAAEDQCLSILRRYPNNATANVLLGDICTEKGDLEQAMQWYEMALDLTPESQAAQHKLESVRQRFKDKETVQTVEQLGLPTTKSRAGLYAVSLIIAIFIIAVVAYALGNFNEKRAVENNGGVIKARGTLENTAGNQTDGSTGNPGPPPREDDPLLKTLKQGTDGARILAAIQDPRTHALTETYAVLEGEDARPLGASLAGQAFDAVSEAPLVTLRGVKEGHVVYVADATRARYEETLSQAWKTDHQADPNAWVNHVLINEWPLKDQPAAPIPAGQTTTAGDQPQDTTSSDKAPADKTAVPADTSDKGSAKPTDTPPATKSEDQSTPSGPPGNDEPSSTGTTGT